MFPSASTHGQSVVVVSKMLCFRVELFAMNCLCMLVLGSERFAAKKASPKGKDWCGSKEHN